MQRLPLASCGRRVQVPMAVTNAACRSFSVWTGVAAPHRLTSQPFRSATSLTSGAPISSSVPSPALLSALVSQRRLCSSTNHTNKVENSPSSMTAPPPADAEPSDSPSGPHSPAVEAQIKEWQARLQHLSPEDQELIISSLLHPEKQKPSVMGGPGIGPKDANMVAAFTCGKCDFRMVKKFSKHAYTKGIVIVECPNCRAKHLIADNLGWLEDEAKNIEDILREKGESFVRVGDGDYQVLGHTEAAENEPTDAQK